ncbi:hypothetical protein CHU92_13810 [Flavobacterium cyanobacteriorum]|uniref:Serine hydrolase family protein n=1 Tax=Flavobacterium cyanobacteriorum TaxID=2022802 RepID=A0A255YUU6_9FLAO|nr:alpha/beta hydrolase [Flavobacterium cyanobacteriorum]OYQ32993.1 hypothetical protein CHU92_13810 [Flavobacterium cyanobacteriorum]
MRNLRIIAITALFCFVSATGYSQRKKNTTKNSMDYRVIIAHAYPADSSTAWYPYIADNLKKQNCEVLIPNFPEPDLKGWQNVLKPLADKSPEKTILIGHSIGCVNILRYLESAGNTKKFPLVILVAPPAFNLGYEQLNSFFATPFDFNTIKSRAEKIVVIMTMQDRVLAPDPMKHGQIFLENVKAKLVILPEGGHFAPFDNVTSLPEVLEEIRSALTQ